MMERFISASLWLVLVLNLIYRVTGNAEGDALTAWKIHLADPYNVLLSWVPRTDPCGWYNITCSGGKSVTKVELVNASLSGSLVPEMGQLWNLEHLELTANNISGIIPEELGNLTNLLSLNLSSNALTGRIPATLGKLTKLSSLRLNNNSLSGTIPMSLTTLTALRVLDLSDNQLVGDIPVNGSFSVFTPVSFANNRFNHLLIQPTKPSAGNSATAAIAGGVAAASALLFAATAIVLV